MKMTNNNFRKFDMRSGYADKLQAQLATLYPTLFRDKKVNTAALRVLQRRFVAGIPFGYIESTWGDYQASDLKAMHTTKSYVATLPTRVLTGSGIVIVGGNGAGKSFLSYMLAIEAIKAGLPTFCMSVWEYLEKRKYQYIVADPFDELLQNIDGAHVVVLDNLSKESENVVWKAEDMLEIVERCIAGRGNRCLIMNTSVGKEEFEDRAGASAISRLSSFDTVVLHNPDFRKDQVDVVEINRVRHQKDTPAPCYKRTALAEASAAPTEPTFPTACLTCAYRARASLCYKRITGKWVNRRGVGPS